MRKSIRAAALTASILAIAAASTPGYAQDATAGSQTEPESVPTEPTPDEIIVTGFRSSLNKAVELKRESIGLRDSIVAEDIGKFPEANVAESMQRIPGVILTRDNTAGSNEGQRVEIRGLGADFVVTTLNGVPVRTTSAGSVGSSSRAFNYDVFPSELFGRVDVYKSPLSHLEEGGIAGNVDLQTPRPFDNNGRVIRYTAQYSYNDRSQKWRPRGSLILSDTWGNFGALFGAAYSKTVNERSGFQSAGGYNSSAIGSRPYHGTVLPNTSGPFQFELNLDNPLANFGGLTRSQIENAMLPRFYRVYGSQTERERLGFVGSLQYRSDRLEISLDGLYSRLTDRMDEFTFGVPVRGSRTVPGSTDPAGTGGNSGIIPLDVHIDQYNNLYGTFGNTSLLTESFFRDYRTTFKYGIARAAYNVTDTMKLSAQASLSKSDAFQSGNRIVSNIYGVTTTFDPTVNVTYPTISSPVDFTNPANYKAPSLAFALQHEVDKQKSGRVALEWTPVDADDEMLAIQVGGSYVSSTKERASQDGSAIARALALPNGGTFASNPSGVFQNMDPYIQFGALSNGGNSGYPSQFATFPRAFVMGTLAANDSNRQAPLQLNQTFRAEEIVKSMFFEGSFKIPIAGHALRGDFGIRYSNTKTLIDNYQSAGAGVFTPAKRKGGYENFLPSVSLAFDITPKLVLRGSVGQTITRAALGDIAAGTAVPNVFSNAITVGNPNLRPQIADSYDAAVEWYFTRGALLSVAVFQKNISDRPTPVVDDIPFSQTGLASSAFSCAAFGIPSSDSSCVIPANALVRRTTMVNQELLKLKGLEIAYQQNFTFLPAPFDGLGITSSFTVIDQTQKGFDFVLKNGDIIKIKSVPDYTYSITGYYEKGPFSIRGSYNYRAKTGQVPVQNNGTDLAGYLAAQGYLDATIAYKINDLFEIRVDALNITNENSYNYFVNPQNPNGFTERDNSYFNGRTFSFGVRGRF